MIKALQSSGEKSLNVQSVEYPIWVSEELLPQVWESEYLSILFLRRKTNPIFSCFFKKTLWHIPFEIGS